MKIIIFLPLILPFVAALLLLLGRQNDKWQKGVSLITNLLLLLTATKLLQATLSGQILVAQMGNWKPPFGIVLAVDILGALMVAISAIVGFTSLLFSFRDIDKQRTKGFYYSLFHFLLFGMNGAFMTGDLFNLFVFFEIVLMTSYVLLILGNEHHQVKSGFTYLMLNLIGSTLFLVGAGILFGQLGTLNMADIAARSGTVHNQGLVTVVAVLFLCVFGLKSAMFPLNNWLPDAYTAPPTPISALFAGILTKVGVYSLFRTFLTIFPNDVSFTHHTLLLPLAGLTMLLGVWGAVVQYDVRSILAFHSISQVGYMLMGLALYTPLAIAGGIFHIIHHSLIKSSLFLIGGGIGHAAGTQNLKKLGGLVSHIPGLSVLFIISALALSGIPPLSGFYSKYALIVGGLNTGHGFLVCAVLMTSLFTLYSMIKIWRLGFWGSWPDKEQVVSKIKLSKVLIPCLISVVFVVLLSLCAGPIMKISIKASLQLLDQNHYIDSVLESNDQSC